LRNIEQVLFDNLPEQQKPVKGGFNFNTGAIDQWFETLPMANIRVATKTIYQTIKETNDYLVPYKKRLYLLEKLHEPVTELALNLKKLNLNRELPLDDKHQRIAVLIRKLYLQTATGYKYILRDLINCRSVLMCPGKYKLMVQVISRIIRHHSLALIADYQFYHAPYKGLWRDLHALFLLAHKESLLLKKIADPSLQLASETSIKNQYLQILLVAVADPYRMAQHHIAALYKQLEEWSALADIHMLEASAEKHSLIIDLSQDTHPSFICKADTSNSEFAWSLDTSKLEYPQLVEHFKAPDTHTTELNIDLLKQISLAWGIIPNRQHNRRPAESKLKVAIGLNNVHYVLNGNREPDWVVSKPAEDEISFSESNTGSPQFTAKTVASTVKVNDIWGEVFNSQLLLEGQKPKPSPEKKAEKTRTNTAPSEWSMVNESIGGYCLLWNHADSINAKVGEIIAISHQEDKKAGYWFIGMIRWMKCLEAHKMQIGVQIMAPNAMAVSTAKYTSMQEGMKSRAILLPAIPVLKQPKTLIMASLGYETNNQVILDEYRLVNANITNVRSKIVLLDKLEVSPHFTRFQYTAAKEYYGTNGSSQPLTQEPDTLALHEDTEFDSIWDDL
jgi:hypothetical protein